MKEFIDSKNFVELEPMKYWSVPASQMGKQHEIIRNAIFSDEYIGALKVDGYYQRIVKDEDGNCFMIARSRNVKGEVVNKLEWLPHINNWLEKLPNGTCLLCECYLPGNEGSKKITSILGCWKDKAITRQKNTPLHLYVFDCIAYNGKSLMNTPYKDRIEYVLKLKENCTDSYIEYAEFFTGRDLWNKLDDYLAAGREGMVIMKKNAIVYEKRTPARVSIKIKKEINSTIDCFFTGRGTAPTRIYTGKEIESWQYWENEYTKAKLKGNYYKDYMEGGSIVPVTKPYYFGWCGSLEIGLVKDGKVVPIGLLSGLTEELKADPAGQKGRVIEVAAMQIESDTMALRHGKMAGFREDKNWKECSWEQLEELK